MSHRWDCPTDWEARREGRRAGERGYGRNPYDDPFPGDSYCEEAAANWRRGFQQGEYYRQEREYEERTAQERADARRHYEAIQQAQMDEQYLYEQQQEEPEPTEGDEEIPAAQPP